MANTDDTQPFDEVLEPAADGGADGAAMPTERPEDAAADLDLRTGPEERARAKGTERGVGAPRVTEPGGVQGSPPTIENERDAYRDQLLRARAEFDNFRKRMERERLQMSARATEDAVRDFLPIIDDLERALAADTGDAGSRFHQGVEMIYRQAREVLRRHGLEPIDAIGQDFDPNIHEAVAYEPVEGRREGEIIGELRRGYRIGDRLVRPALVRVAQELR